MTNVPMPFGAHMPTTIPRAAAVAACLYGHLGPNNTTIPMQVYQYTEATPNDKIWTDLWSAWDGRNWPSTEIFLKDLTTRGSEFMDLFPIVTKKVAMEQYGMNFKGDIVTFDEWDFTGRVISNASKRHPAKLNRSTRISKTQAMYFASDGFEMPMDFVADETLMRVFLSHMEQLNLNIHLTWTFRLLEVLVDQGLFGRVRRLEERRRLPMNHSQFDHKYSTDNDAMFGIQKPNSKGYALIESDAYNAGRDRSVFFDTVITTSGSLVFTGLIRPELGIYAERGEEIYNKKTPEPVGVTASPAKTPGYGLNILETRKFELGEGQEARDPTVYQANVAHRYLMSPHILPQKTITEDYRSEMRSIEIPDADNNCNKTLDLKTAFLYSCIFSTRSDAPTPVGLEILKRLCARRSTNGAGYHGPGGPGGPRGGGGGGRGFPHGGGGGGSGDNDDFGDDGFGSGGPMCPPFFGGSGDADDDATLNPNCQFDDMNDGLPRAVNAYTLFRNAEILDEVIKVFRCMPEERWRSFTSELTAQGLRKQPVYQPPQPSAAIGSRSHDLTELDMLVNATQHRLPAFPVPHAPGSGAALAKPTPRTFGSGMSGFGSSSGGSSYGLAGLRGGSVVYTPAIAIPKPSGPVTPDPTANVWLKSQLPANVIFFPMDHDDKRVIFGRVLGEGKVPQSHEADIYTKLQKAVRGLMGRTIIDDRFKQEFQMEVAEFDVVLPRDHPLKVVDMLLLTTLVQLANTGAANGQGKTREKYQMWYQFLLGPDATALLPRAHIDALANLKTTGILDDAAKRMTDLLDKLKIISGYFAGDLAATRDLASVIAPALSPVWLANESDAAVLGGGAFKDTSHKEATNVKSPYADYPFLRGLLSASRESLPPPKMDAAFSRDQLEWLSEHVLLQRRSLDECDQLLIERAIYKIITGEIHNDPKDKAYKELVSWLPKTDLSDKDKKSAGQVIEYILKQSTTRPDAHLRLSPEERARMLQVQREMSRSVREQKKRRFRDLADADSDVDEDDMVTDACEKDEGDGNSGKRLRLAPAKHWFRSAASVCRTLYKMRLTKNFFHQLILNDVPFPMVFLVFQPHIRIMAGCCIFLKSGPETAIMAINHGAIVYGRDVNTFTVNVSARLSAGAFVRKDSNLEFVPHTFATKYNGGAGVRPYDWEEHRERYSAETYPADLFFCACPFWYMSGEMDPTIYSDDSFTGPMYPTADLYCRLWDSWSRKLRPVPHMWSREHYLESSPRNNHLCVQSSQHCWQSAFGAAGGKGGLTFVYGGNSPLGKYVTTDIYTAVRQAGAFQGRVFIGQPRSSLLPAQVN